MCVPSARAHRRMNWQWDDETGEATKLAGFDMSEPTARNQGKPEVSQGRGVDRKLIRLQSC